MAGDTSDGINYFISIEKEHLDFLGEIRHWQNIKIGFEEALVWLKDLTHSQVDAIEVKCIPFKQLYYSKGAKLFRQGSLLPERNIPPLLWTAIDRGLPVKLPSFNHNYFGITEKIAIKIIASSEEAEAYALLTSMQSLGSYLETASAIRLKNLQWSIINDQAMIFGVPLLPVNGTVYWRNAHFLFPAGYNLELHTLLPVLNNMLNESD